MSAAIQIFNLLADGVEGGTVSRSGAPLPEGGFFVGGVVQSLIFESVDHANHPDALTAIAGFLTIADTPHVGFWVDTETGLVYVDLVDWFKSERDALHLARVRGEIAVWDIANAQEVRVGHVATV